MPAIILPESARQPRTQARINWSDPYSNGLTYAGDLRGPHVVDLVSGKVDTSSFSTIPKAGEGYGPVVGPVRGAYSASSVGGRIFYGPGAALMPVQSTHLLVMRVGGVSGAYGGVFSCSDSTGSNGYFSLQADGSGSSFVIYTTNSESGSFDTVSAIADNRVHAWAFATASGTSGSTVYRDGSFYKTISSIGLYSPPANGRIVYFGARNASTSYGSYGLIAHHFIWNRKLAGPELAEITRNPWRLITPEAKILYFPSAGGGGATTLTADSGAYTLTGTAATLKADRKLAADSGSYAITGTDVSLKLGRKLTAESGTYTVNGTDVSLTAGRKLAADSGTYSLTGTDVTLTYQPAGGYTLAADSGSYTLTGTAATLKASRKLTADSGTYALTGTDVTLTRGFKITADSGTYTVTGSNVAFARTYRLPADSGSYTLSGSPVSLSWSGEVVPVAPTHGGPSIYGKAVFREAEFKREYEREVSRIEAERFRARQMREDEEIVIIMAALAA